MRKVISLITLICLFAVGSASGFVFTDPKVDNWRQLDKLSHFGEHLIFSSYLYLNDREEWTPQQYWQTAIYAFIGSGVAGGVYETVGGFLPKGSDGFSLKDFAADGLGSLAGAGGTMLLFRSGSPGLRKLTLKYRENGLARFCVSGLASGFYYTLERTVHQPRTISDRDLFWHSSFSVLSPNISLQINQTFFFPKKNNIHWEKIFYDIAGSLLGAWIAKQFVEYNPGRAKKISRLWQSSW